MVAVSRKVSLVVLVVSIFKATIGYQPAKIFVALVSNRMFGLFENRSTLLTD